MNAESYCRADTGNGRCGLKHGHYGRHACCQMHQKMTQRGETMPPNYWEIVEANKGGV